MPRSAHPTVCKTSASPGPADVTSRLVAAVGDRGESTAGDHGTRLVADQLSRYEQIGSLPSRNRDCTRDDQHGVGLLCRQVDNVATPLVDDRHDDVSQSQFSDGTADSADTRDGSRGGDLAASPFLGKYDDRVRRQVEDAGR